MPRALNAWFACCIAVSTVTGCSRNVDSAALTYSEPPPREFGKEDKLAASFLSLGSSATIHAATPYSRALLCRNAIGVVYKRMTRSAALNGKQLRAFESARNYFDREIRTLAVKENRSGADIQRDLAQAARNNPGFGANAQQLVACIRELEKGV